MARTRFGRARLLVLANVTAIALLAGCGGSSVEPTGADAGTAAEAQAPAATDGQAAPTTQVPGAAGTTAPTGGQATGAVAPGAAAGGAASTRGGATTTQGSAKTGSGAAAASGAKSGTGAAAGSALAAERMVATAPIFGGNGVCKPATLSEVPIGNVSTLSGVLGELFSPVSAALSTFVASQNACGGLNGHKIKFFQDDDQGDPSTAITKVQDMIQTKKVLAFVGNIQVLTVDAVAPIIKRYGVPILGSDMSNNSWFSNPLMFPQGSPPQAVSYGFNLAARDYFKKPVLGTMYCIEVPRACENFNTAVKDIAPMMKVAFKKDYQVSLTAPSYVQQCLDLKNAGVQVLGLLIDAASQNRIARSCTQVGFTPNVVTTPISVGNEKQFLTGNKWLGNSYVAMNTFPWVANTTPAQKYWQASIKKYNPGFSQGGAASMGWASGALLVAASAGLSETNPTTQQLLDTLWTFKGQKFTELGGLAPGPRTFGQDASPKVPYCLYTMVTNAADNGWGTVVATPSCTDLLSPSDPQKSR